jgi:hypothetical protein
MRVRGTGETIASEAAKFEPVTQTTSYPALDAATSSSTATPVNTLDQSFVVLTTTASTSTPSTANVTESNEPPPLVVPGA